MPAAIFCSRLVIEISRSLYIADCNNIRRLVSLGSPDLLPIRCTGAAVRPSRFYLQALSDRWYCATSHQSTTFGASVAQIDNRTIFKSEIIAYREDWEAIAKDFLLGVHICILGLHGFPSFGNETYLLSH